MPGVLGVLGVLEILGVLAGIQNISTKPSLFRKALMLEASHVYSRTDGSEAPDPGGAAYEYRISNIGYRISHSKLYSLNTEL